METLAKRKPNRLPDYDYSRDGIYFLTVCAINQEPIFGRMMPQKTSVGGGALDARKSQ